MLLRWVHEGLDAFRGVLADGRELLRSFGAELLQLADQDADAREPALTELIARSRDKHAELARITCPVYGFYGENDARITAGVPATTGAMKKARKTFEPEIYPGAGHGLVSAGEAPDASHANKKACAESWKRWKAGMNGSHSPIAMTSRLSRM